MSKAKFRLEHGFLRVLCTDCHAEKLVAFSCKRRGFCPSCGARRMMERAALLVDEVLPAVPMRPMFPTGWPGTALLLLRIALSTNVAYGLLEVRTHLHIVWVLAILALPSR